MARKVNQQMTPATAEKVFKHLMQVSQERRLRPLEADTLKHAVQVLRYTKRRTAANPHQAKRPVKIYDRVLRLEAVKNRRHTYGGKISKKGQQYFHDFSTEAEVWGMPDGSLWIKSKK